MSWRKRRRPDEFELDVEPLLTALTPEEAIAAVAAARGTTLEARCNQLLEAFIVAQAGLNADERDIFCAYAFVCYLAVERVF